MHFFTRLSLCLGLILALGACEPAAPPAPEVTQTEPAKTRSNPLTSEDRQQLEQFRKAASALPQALAKCSTEMQASMQTFLKQPDAGNLKSLRSHWKRCHEIYLATTLLRGFSAQQQTQLEQLHAQLGNPLTMPGFIDSVTGYPFSGIVNDASLELTETALRQQHGLTDEAEVSLGFAVVGFLIWGEQVNDPNKTERPVSDFTAVSQWQDSNEDLPVSEHPNNRRRSLLQITVDALNQDCEALLKTWDDASLPDSHEQATEWKVEQIQALINGLDQWPDNQTLATTLREWLQQSVIPSPLASPENTDPAQPLRVQLENSLKQIKAQG